MGSEQEKALYQVQTPMQATQQLRLYDLTELMVLEVSVIDRDAVQSFCQAAVGESQYTPLHFGSRKTPSSIGMLLLINSFLLAIVPQWRSSSYYVT